MCTATTHSRFASHTILSHKIRKYINDISLFVQVIVEWEVDFE